LPIGEIYSAGLTHLTTAGESVHAPVRAGMGGVPMRNLKIAIAAMVASLFAVIFWAQVWTIAIAAAGAKTETYALSSSPYIRSLQPAY
jgi:hypothetical protein